VLPGRWQADKSARRSIEADMDVMRDSKRSPDLRDLLIVLGLFTFVLGEELFNGCHRHGEALL